jgi:N-acetylglutamate synthase-like GNAT family acetyltransferase
MDMTPSVTLRRATQGDQARIKEIIRQVHINPLGLAWQRFWIAESEGTVVGTGQIKVHNDGTRELASIAVIPTHQHQEIASQLIRTLLEDEQGWVYLMCRRLHETFYQRFEFQVIIRQQMPKILRRTYDVLRIFRLLAPLIGHDFDVIIMRRGVNLHR